MELQGYSALGLPGLFILTDCTSVFTCGSSGTPWAYPLAFTSPPPSWLLEFHTKPWWVRPGPSKLRSVPEILKQSSGLPLPIGKAWPCPLCEHTRTCAPTHAPSVVRPTAISPCLCLGLPTAALKLRRQTRGRGPWHQPRVTGTPMFAKKHL